MPAGSKQVVPVPAGSHGLLASEGAARQTTMWCSTGTGVRRNGWEVHEGTGSDSRTVLAQVPRHVKDGFLLDEVP